MMFPEMGRRGLVAGTREWHIPDLPYIVIYKVDPGRTRLDVLAIYHGAQDR
jgi:plasmid stabilization system protein ParE